MSIDTEICVAASGLVQWAEQRISPQGCLRYICVDVLKLFGIYDFSQNQELYQFGVVLGVFVASYFGVL